MQNRLESTRNSTNSHRIFVAIVSHFNDHDIIENLNPKQWLQESKKIKPVILSNVHSDRLNNYCARHKIPYIENKVKRGFGANNNSIYKYTKEHLQIKTNDYFFCINPDIRTSAREIESLARIMQKNELKIAAPNLLDSNNQADDNIRTYPAFIDILLRFALKSARTTVDKSNIHTITAVDWASGAYLCFRADIYQKLEGYDERYFMYYEDADICRRGSIIGEKTYYIPEIKAVHFADRKSRSLLSKALFWHITSTFRFLTTNNSKNIST